MAPQRGVPLPVHCRRTDDLTAIVDAAGTDAAREHSGEQREMGYDSAAPHHWSRSATAPERPDDHAVIVDRRGDAAALCAAPKRAEVRDMPAPCPAHGDVALVIRLGAGAR